MAQSVFSGNFRFRLLIIAALFICPLFGEISASVQQPFVTDNTDVTDKGKFHFETSSEIDRLQNSLFPIKYQNGLHATLAYGLLKDVEVSATGDFLTLVSDRSVSPRLVSGIGDTTFAVKYNFRRERENSQIPAMTVSAFVQFPTGDASRSLGSGITDYGIYGVAQKTFKEKNVVRVNGGYLFAGNTVTGVEGISAVRGQIFTGSASIVRRLNEKLQLGGEIAGALTSQFQLSKGQLQFQFGGNYNLRKNLTLDFGLITGRYAASPRVGGQLGFSVDF